MTFSGSGSDPAPGSGSRSRSRSNPGTGSGSGDLDPRNLESPPPARGDDLAVEVYARQEDIRRLQSYGSDHVDPRALELPAPARGNSLTVEVHARQEDGRISKLHTSGSGHLDPTAMELPASSRGVVDMRHLEEYVAGQGRTSFSINISRTISRALDQYGSDEIVPQKLEQNRDRGSELYSPSGSDHMVPSKPEQNNKFRPELSKCCIGLQESVQKELLRRPSVSAGQSLSEHADVSVETARAKLMVAANRSRSIAKELGKAAARLEHLQQNIAALPKEEKKAVVKEIRKVKENMSRLRDAAALANEDVATEQDNVTRALLRYGV